MSIQSIQLSIAGFLGVGRVSSENSSLTQRTLKRVLMATRGTNPAGADIGIQIQFGGVPQVTNTFVLPAGLKFAENLTSVIVPAATIISCILTAAPDGLTSVDLDITLEFEVAPESGGLDTTDCGLGTLGELKRFCINAGVTVDYGVVLTLIGKGIAKSFNNCVDRRFKREVGVFEQFSFSRRNLVSVHTPIETITKMELKYSEAEGWIDLTTGLPLCLVNNEDGIVTVPDDFWPISVQFQHGKPGIWRLTLTGGYWYDPTDNGTGVPPTGAFVLPDDLKLAWLLQCQHMFLNRDNLGITFLPSGEVHDTRKSLANVKFIPDVQNALANYHRAVNLR